MKWYETGPRIIKPVITRVKRRVPYDPFNPGPMVKIEDVWGFPNCHSVSPHTGRDTGHVMWFKIDPLDGSMFPHPIVSGKYKNCTEMPTGESFNMEMPASALPNSGAYLPQWVVRLSDDDYVLGTNFAKAVEFARRLYMSQFGVYPRQDYNAHLGAREKA